MLTGLIIFLVLAGVSAVIGAIYAIRPGRQRNRMRAVAPVTLDAALVDGQEVRVIGIISAIDKQTVQGPWSGTPCVAAVGETWEMGGGSRVRRLDRSVRHTPFAVTDGAGTATLVLDHVELDLELVPVALAEGGLKRVFGAGVIAANMGQNRSTLEGRLHVGDRIAVVGTVARAEGALTLVGTARAPLGVSNHPSTLA